MDPPLLPQQQLRPRPPSDPRSASAQPGQPSPGAAELSVRSLMVPVSPSLPGAGEVWAPSKTRAPWPTPDLSYRGEGGGAVSPPWGASLGPCWRGAPGDVLMRLQQVQAPAPRSELDIRGAGRSRRRHQPGARSDRGAGVLRAPGRRRRVLVGTVTLGAEPAPLAPSTAAQGLNLGRLHHCRQGLSSSRPQPGRIPDSFSSSPEGPGPAFLGGQRGLPQQRARPGHTGFLATVPGWECRAAVPSTGCQHRAGCAPRPSAAAGGGRAGPGCAAGGTGEPGRSGCRGAGAREGQCEWKPGGPRQRLLCAALKGSEGSWACGGRLKSGDASVLCVRRRLARGHRERPGLLAGSSGLSAARAPAAGPESARLPAAPREPSLTLPPLGPFPASCDWDGPERRVPASLRRGKYVPPGRFPSCPGTRAGRSRAPSPCGGCAELLRPGPLLCTLPRLSRALSPRRSTPPGPFPVQHLHSSSGPRADRAHAIRVPWGRPCPGPGLD